MLMKWDTDMEKTYQLRFYTPGYDESKEGDVFGCASFGLCDEKDWFASDQAVCLTYGNEIKGILINSSLEEARGQIVAIPNKADVKAGIVLFGNCGGENGFMKFLSVQKTERFWFGIPQGKMLLKECVFFIPARMRLFLDVPA
jgi:hypothetical protein